MKHAWEATAWLPATDAHPQPWPNRWVCTQCGVKKAASPPSAKNRWRRRPSYSHGEMRAGDCAEIAERLARAPVMQRDWPGWDRGHAP